MRKQLLNDHNFLNNSPIVIIESSTFDIFAFQEVPHTIHFNLKNCFGSGERYLTPQFYGRMRVPAVSKNMHPLKRMKSSPGAGCLQWLVRRRWQWPTTSLSFMHYRRHARLFLF